MSPGTSSACGAVWSFPRVSGDEPLGRTVSSVRNRFPRVSGDEPRWRWWGYSGEGFSPRERG